MSEQVLNLRSLPWIPDEAKRVKYEEKDDRVAIADNPVTGTLTGHGTRDNFRKDGKYNVVTLTLDDGREVDVHCQATVLANQMLDARPKYGERVTVAFLGYVQGNTAGTQPYANYKVKVEREAGGEISWAGAVPDEPVRTTASGQDAPIQNAPAPAAAPAPAVAPADADDEDIPFLWIDGWDRELSQTERHDPWRR